MGKIQEIQQELIRKVHLELTGHEDISLNSTHFEKLHSKTGTSVRKLKELFGIYSKRSRDSHEFTLSKLAQFIGFEDWNCFVKQQMVKKKIEKMNSQNRKPITIKKKN